MVHSMPCSHKSQENGKWGVGRCNTIAKFDRFYLACRSAQPTSADEQSSRTARIKVRVGQERLQIPITLTFWSLIPLVPCNVV